MAKIDEWSIQKRWNPFNSYKLLTQVYRWELIERGKPIPQPALITVDPTNSCNFNCPWCNSAIVRKRKGAISRETLNRLAGFLAEWQGSPCWPKGVEAVCIAGGGEPLLHKDLGEFIGACCEKGIEVGVVTNGYYIDNFIEPLSMCTWVGVSIDAGTKQVFNEIKGLPPSSRAFSRVIKNIEKLVEVSGNNETRLGNESPAYGVSYKYLLSVQNVNDVYKAAKIAKEIGCKNFHLRPVGATWFDLAMEKKFINKDLTKRLAEQIEKARELETMDFSVYSVTHKFGEQFEREHQFQKCHAIFMTCVFMPPVDPAKKDAITVGLCCDRRGDATIELARDLEDVEKTEELWGSEAHWRFFDSINIDECPRCTYQPHNQIYEQVIKKDLMTYRFI
ncbi:MAG: radical SAM protein [Desulfobacteraceae bacterium]|nr:radical SAM protein [Desulfobacteraceae bacterium]